MIGNLSRPVIRELIDEQGAADTISDLERVILEKYGADPLLLRLISKHMREAANRIFYAARDAGGTHV